MTGLKGISLLLLVSLGVLLMVVAGAEDAEGATITVPDDYPTIQSAIDNATDYDTLFIKDGLYIESVVVYKPLTIIGESQTSTVIHNNDPYAVLIVGHRVSLSSVMVQGTTTGAGLILQASNCVIEDVTVKDSLWGIWVNRGYHNVVRNVQCLDNSWQGLLVEEADDTLLQDVTCKGNNEGINVRAAVNTTLRNCRMIENRVHGFLAQRLVGVYETEGIRLLNCIMSQNILSGCEIDFTDRVTIEGCTVEDNGAHGIIVRSSNDTIVRGCTVRNYLRFGIGYSGDWVGSRCTIEDNILEDEGSSWSDILVRYSKDCRIIDNKVTCQGGPISLAATNDTFVSGNVLTSTNDNQSLSYPGIIVARGKQGQGQPSNNVTILDCIVRGFEQGMAIRAAVGITISGCTVEDADVGIFIMDQGFGDVPFVDGFIEDCTFIGCGLDIQGMTRGSIKGNIIEGAGTGIFINATIYPVDDNLFISNVIMDCTEYGLYFNATNGTNIFYLNDFINNTEHASAPGPNDEFDNGKEGNHWDDYSERYPDASVVGVVWDTPYAVGMSTIMDQFPLAYVFNNEAPMADAGEPQYVSAGTIVELDGSGSSDDYGISNYSWTFNYFDTPLELKGKVVTFPFLLIGDYEVFLEVKDVWGNSGFDSTLIVVRDDEPPVANAGVDIYVDMGKEFTLTGSASTDNGFIVTYEWSVDPEGLDRVMEGEAAMFTIDVPGDYAAVLRVYDEAGNWDIDDVTIHVLDTEDPVADAGRDFAADQGEVVTLFGGWSRDNVAVFSWTWTFPEDGEVMIEVGETVDREFPIPGAYTIMLNVSDAAGNWDVDELRLTVRDTEPPVADAGMDIQGDQGTLVTLDGTDSTDNVGVVGFIWLFAEGSNLKNLLGAEASYQFDIPGEYELELQAWDAAGNVGFDWVIVTVNEVGTITPWRLGPFKDDSGELGGVRVEVLLDGNPYVAYTDDDGEALFIVGIGHLVSPASVLAEKEGWKTLEFTKELDSNGDAIGSIPVMKRDKGGDGDDDDDDDDDDIDWLAWGLVIILMIAYAGTLLYLSDAAKRADEE